MGSLTTSKGYSSKNSVKRLKTKAPTHLRGRLDFLLPLEGGKGQELPFTNKSLFFVACCAFGCFLKSRKD
jgi:hypothetical protein